ncbi:hypothetical protein SPSIL_027000 [Sporomusa silvacetica DSM 10669]|uniref:Uncharacterized protein n=2 Tax=Sporomusa silvacetica TaxID=55504 RepID=A0ABZ3ILJ4_9FIRM|nr:hypothetical protein SPSIL_39240 [Sporomusa silvacetica DSM 10669]
MQNSQYPTYVCVASGSGEMEVIMKDLPGTPQSTPESSPASSDVAVQPDIKKKDIDQMIEEFKKANPGKNQRKIHRGVF